MPKSAQVKDADILKYDLGINLVRTSHYPQSRHFLDRCDEIGLLVFEEIPGWQYIGDEEFRQNTLKNLEAMIKRDYNRPSIIMWGVRINESPDDHDLYEKTNLLARRLDSTRPTGGVRNLIKSEFLEDVYTYNDFIHSGENEALRHPDQVKKNVPYLVTEYNGHMFPTKRYDVERLRVEHALRHYRVIDAASKCDRISGTVGWCMSDYNTHDDFGSGDNICYHGVLDMFRLPKYASYIYSSQQSEKPVLEVLSTMNVGDHPMSWLPEVHIASNMDYIKVYRGDSYIGTFYPDKESRLPYPLITIKDFIGDQLIDREGLSRRDSERVKKIFREVPKYGHGLPLCYKLMMFFLMRKYRFSITDGINLYYKYCNPTPNYRIEGYIRDKLVKKVIKEFVRSTNYRIESDNSVLEIADTYDTTRVVVSKHDQNGNLLPYAFDAFRVKTLGGIDLIGPDQLALSAGQMAFWVKTNGKDEDGRVNLSFPSQELSINIQVKRR
jgi:beta-galactosidase